jgi:pimeloyl-ACP methyl ester carboxylesterase
MLPTQTHGRLARGLIGTARRASLCGQVASLVCTQVTVPLDPTGAVPGSISLHVEELPAAGTPKGVMFLVAGGPGQGSANSFGLGDPTADSNLQFLFPGYTLVAYDDRGTGASGLIDCPGLQVALTIPAEIAGAAACGNSLGPAAPFYSTALHAADLDAVRQALGFDKIGVYGVSYGTKLAMAYALGYPQHVDRLLLGSVVPPNQADPWDSYVLQEIPKTLPSYCVTGGCNGAQYASDMVALANRLGAKALTGKVKTGTGALKQQKVDGLDLLSIVLDGDLNPGEAAALPAVIHAARIGNAQPLLRLAQLHDIGSVMPSIDLSFGLYAATVCADGPFPWSPSTAPGQRPALLQQAVSTAPAGTFGPFGSWAAGFGNAPLCTGWPGPTGNAPLGTGPLPNVPMLAISGGLDLRTPTVGAQAVVSQFPQGHLVVVPSVGHDPVDQDFLTNCAANAVHTWITTGAAPASCPVQKPLVMPVPPLPSPSKHVLTAQATYAAAKATVGDAQAMWLMSGTPAPVPGVFGGRMLISGRTVKLENYTVTTGVTVSGTLTLKKIGLPLGFQGAVTVGGSRAQHGILGLNGASLRGTLGGRRVG